LAGEKHVLLSARLEVEFPLMFPAFSRVSDSFALWYVLTKGLRT